MAAPSAFRRIKRWALHTYVLRSADVVCVSFPKAGRTWLRMLVGQALVKRYGLVDVPIETIVAVTPLKREAPDMPTILFTHDRNPEGSTPEEIVGRTTRGYRRTKVILLVRDPRDVAVSLFFQRAKRKHLQGDDVDTRTMGEFMRAERGGLRSAIAFYSHWWRGRDDPAGFLVVRYEDLHSDPHSVLREVLSFAGITGVDEQMIADSVEAASFANMHKLEQSGAFKSEALTPGAADDPESFKTRRGKVGGYHDYVTADDEQWMDAQLATLPAELGYGSKHK